MGNWLIHNAKWPLQFAGIATVLGVLTLYAPRINALLYIVALFNLVVGAVMVVSGALMKEAHRD